MSSDKTRGKRPAASLDPDPPEEEMISEKARGKRPALSPEPGPSPAKKVRALH